MTNRDWIRRVLARQPGVAVPYNLPLSPPARKRLEEHFDTNDVEQYLDLPIRMIGPTSVKPLYASPRQFGDRAVDEFGVAWSTSRIDRGSPVGPCLKTAELRAYTFPDPTAEYRFERLGEWCEQNTSHYTIMWVGDLWERATFMCGMERLLLFTATQPAFVEELMERIADYVLRTLDVLLQRFSFDAVALSDDYGVQRSLLIHPDAWRRFVKPHLAAILSRARSARRTTFLHSCGNVRQIVPDLVELGLDILHPIQPEAMDVLELKRQFGHSLTFCGGLGTQDLLVHATPEEIRAEVHRLQAELGHNGGYILEPGITLQADVPLENILALISAAQQGR